MSRRGYVSRHVRAEDRAYERWKATQPLSPHQPAKPPPPDPKWSTYWKWVGVLLVANWTIGGLVVLCRWLANL